MVELIQQPQKKSQMKLMGRLWLQLLRYYFRVEVKGLENIPKHGRAMICPNHSGFAGADAVLLTFIIKRETKRRARILAHRAFFDFSETLKAISESHGLRRASISGGVEILEKDRLLVIFPEGESGNFKPTYKRYRLQRFHTGYLRMAMQAKAPIIPCVIIGAEETHLNLGNLDFSKFIKHLRIPLPVNFLPLPAKWTITFLPPIDTTKLDPAILDHPLELKREAMRFQRMMQREIRYQLRNRKYVYFERTQHLLDSAAKTFSEWKKKRRAASTGGKKKRKRASA